MCNHVAYRVNNTTKMYNSNINELTSGLLQRSIRGRFKTKLLYIDTICPQYKFLNLGSSSTDHPYIKTTRQALEKL